MDYNTTPFPFRMTEKMREDLEKAASKNRRSLNQEVTEAVQSHLSNQKLIEDLSERLERIEQIQAEILAEVKANKR